MDPDYSTLPVVSPAEVRQQLGSAIWESTYPKKGVGFGGLGYPKKGVGVGRI